MVPIIGDLISTSWGALMAAWDAGAPGAGRGSGVGMYGSVWASSYWAVCMLPLTPRLSLILKSCLSNSNSAMEFFFIKSMMALISFKSTIRFQLDFCRVVHPATLANIKHQRGFHGSIWA